MAQAQSRPSPLLFGWGFLEENLTRRIKIKLEMGKIEEPELSC